MIRKPLKCFKNMFMKRKTTKEWKESCSRIFFNWDWLSNETLIFFVIIVSFFVLDVSSLVHLD